MSRSSVATRQALYLAGLRRFAAEGWHSARVRDIVADAMAAIIWRTYDSNGYGGLFPLRNPREDQRKVELWYQLNAYLLEQF